MFVFREQGDKETALVFAIVIGLVLLFFFIFRNTGAYLDNEGKHFSTWLLVYTCVCVGISVICAVIAWAGASGNPVAQVMSASVSISFFMSASFCVSCFDGSLLDSSLALNLFEFAKWVAELLNVGVAIATAVLVLQQQTTAACGEVMKNTSIVSTIGILLVLLISFSVYMTKKKIGAGYELVNPSSGSL